VGSVRRQCSAKAVLSPCHTTRICAHDGGSSPLGCHVASRETEHSLPYLGSQQAQKRRLCLWMTTSAWAVTAVWTSHVWPWWTGALKSPQVFSLCTLETPGSSRTGNNCLTTQGQGERKSPILLAREKQSKMMFLVSNCSVANLYPSTQFDLDLCVLIRRLAMRNWNVTWES
jgi:hypothetical protein